MRSNVPSNAIANCASPANASSTPIAVSASTPSRRPFMGSFRYRDDQPHEETAVTLDAFLEQPDATAVRLEEIGRASWREQVCQYVSVSGVAGDLKKKTAKE